MVMSGLELYIVLLPILVATNILVAIIGIQFELHKNLYLISKDSYIEYYCLK